MLFLACIVITVVILKWFRKFRWQKFKVQKAWDYRSLELQRLRLKKFQLQMFRATEVLATELLIIGYRMFTRSFGYRTNGFELLATDQLMATDIMNNDCDKLWNIKFEKGKNNCLSKSPMVYNTSSTTIELGSVPNNDWNICYSLSFFFLVLVEKAR